MQSSPCMDGWRAEWICGMLGSEDGMSGAYAQHFPVEFLPCLRPGFCVQWVCLLEDSAEISLFGVHHSQCREDWIPWRRLSSSSLVDNNKYLDSGIPLERKSLKNFSVAVQFLPLLSPHPPFPYGDPYSYGTLPLLLLRSGLLCSLLVNT